MAADKKDKVAQESIKKPSCYFKSEGNKIFEKSYLLASRKNNKTRNIHVFRATVYEDGRSIVTAVYVGAYSMWPLDRTAPGPDALYSSRHFLAESELKSENSLWKDSTIFLHSFFRLVSFMWL